MQFKKTIDVLGIGNAIVDIVAKSDDDFIKKFNLVKGSMILSDKIQSEDILGQIKPIIKTSGGSAANTIFGLSQLGLKGAFIGKTSDDAVGNFFKEDLEFSNIIFNTLPKNTKEPSGRCLILVTPDAERTMITFLGSSKDLEEKDIDEKMISQSKIVYLEGYLFDPPEAQKAFQKASYFAHQHASSVAFTLSDSFCVNRHREKMKEFISREVDILFCNEAEAMALYKKDTVESCVRPIRSDVDIAAITLGGKGALIIKGDEVLKVAAFSTTVVDTTGAGDFFAAGFLAGISKQLTLQEAGKIGAACSAEIISHYGARPLVKLSSLI